MTVIAVRNLFVWEGDEYGALSLVPGAPFDTGEIDTDDAYDMDPDDGENDPMWGVFSGPDADLLQGGMHPSGSQPSHIALDSYSITTVLGGSPEWVLGGRYMLVGFIYDGDDIEPDEPGDALGWYGDGYYNISGSFARPGARPQIVWAVTGSRPPAPDPDPGGLCFWMNLVNARQDCGV